MIEINLLPEELKKRKRPSAPKIDIAKINIDKPLLVKIGLVAAGVIIAIQVAVFGFGMIGSIVLNSLEKKYNKIEAERKEAGRLKADVAKMDKKVAAIDELMVKSFSWAKKLNSLSDSISPGIWLTRLECNEKTVERSKSAVASVHVAREKPAGRPATEKVVEEYLIISGAASNTGEEGTALIGRFIKNLKENPSFYSDFSDIELGGIKMEQLSGQKIMTFKITCLFKVK